jgi:membrane-bound lytic murein transglycosylase D
MPTATAEQDLVVIDQRIAKLESEMVSRLDRIINQLGAPPATTSEKPTAKPAAEKPPKKEVAEAKPEVHTVQAGDTLYRISRRYNVSVENLREYNQLQAGTAIYPGQKLKLVPPQAD